MIAVMGLLGDTGVHKAAETRFQRRKGTPRISRPTMRVMSRNGWVCPIKIRRRRGVWAKNVEWQISPTGKRALLSAHHTITEKPQR